MKHTHFTRFQQVLSQSLPTKDCSDDPAKKELPAHPEKVTRTTFWALGE